MRVTWLIALAGVVLAGCAGGAPMADESSTSGGSTARDGLVFELEIGRVAPERRIGMRIHDDGRVELRGDLEPRIDDAGRVQVDRVELAWREEWRYTPQELERVRAAIADAAARLGPRYPDPVTDTDRRLGQRMVWRLRDRDGELAETVVEGHPFKTPAVLDELYPKLFTLHERPVERTVWRVWSDGEVAERRVDCEVGRVPALRALRGALFNPDARSSQDAPPSPSSDPPDGVPLVEIEFHPPQGPDSVYRLFADGRQQERRDGDDRPKPRMGAEQLAAVREALAGVGFASLPDPVC